MEPAGSRQMVCMFCSGFSALTPAVNAETALINTDEYCMNNIGKKKPTNN